MNEGDENGKKNSEEDEATCRSAESAAVVPTDGVTDSVRRNHTIHVFMVCFDSRSSKILYFQYAHYCGVCMSSPYHRL